MADQGWIKVWRGWRDNPVLRGPSSRKDAWVWLIENACWKPTRARINGQTVTLERGELSFSVRFLADQWGWSKSAVDRFLDALRAEGMIETRSKTGTHAGTDAGTAAKRKPGQGQNVLKVCNYDEYQSDDEDGRDSSGTATGTAAGRATGTTAGQQRDKEEEGKKERKNIHNHPTSASHARAREDAAPPLDAAARLDGGGEESREADSRADELLPRIAETCGLALTPAKRKAALATLADWLDGWPGCDPEADLLAPIRSFLFTHDGPTHSLARFDALIRDRKARAKPKAKPATKPRPPADEPAEVVQLRDAIRDELGDADSAAWMDPARIEIGPEAVAVICPGAFHAEHVTNHLKPRIGAVTRRICRRPVDVRAA